jgi:hypothetical protein
MTLTGAISALALTAGFRLDHHEDPRRFRTIRRSPLWAAVRLLHPALLGPPRQQPASIREDFLRRFDLKPSKFNVAVTLLDEQAC